MGSDHVFIQSGLDSFQGQRLHYLYQQPGPLLHCLHWEKVFHYIQSELLLLQFIFVAHPPTMCCCEELGSVISQCPLFRVSASPPVLVSSAHLLRLHCNTSSRAPEKILNRTGTVTDPCSILLVTGLQTEYDPLTTIL